MASRERKIHVYARSMMIIPDYYGFGGGSTNERQLMTFLTEKFEISYIISLDKFKNFLRRQRHSVRRHNKVFVLSLPVVDIHPVLVNLSVLFYSFAIAFLASLLKLINRINIIYVRGSLAAVGLCALKQILGLKPIALKFAAFASDEINPRTTSFLKRFTQVFFNAIDTYVINKSDLIIVHSNEMRKYIEKRCLIRNKSFAICPPGVDTDKISKVTKNIRRTTDEFRIGFLGNVSLKQGVDILVESVFMVQKLNPNVTLYIVGYGKDLEKIKLIAQKLTVNVVTTGYVPHDVALSYLKTFDVLVVPRRRSPSTRTNIPIKILEAFALGVPVIITRDKVLLDMFRDYEDVLYVEPHPDDVAEKICLLISDEEYRKKLQNNGPILAKKFDYHKIAENLYYLMLKTIAKDENTWL